jgi:hypothetical protein
VKIENSTPVFNKDAEQIGELLYDNEKGIVLKLTTEEEFSGILVLYDRVAEASAPTNDLLVGKTYVLFYLTDASITPEVSMEAATPTPVDTPDSGAVVIPAEGWIDTSLVVAALSEQHETDVQTIQERDITIAQLQQVEIATPIPPAPTPVTISNADEGKGIFSKEKVEIWVPVMAVTLGIFCLGALIWIAVSASNSAGESERTVRQLAKLNDRFTEGLPIKTPLRVEQIAWPREGHVRLAPDAAEQLAAVSAQSGAQPERVNTPVKEVEVPPPPIPEGQEPDLLQLANRLAGVASAADWRAIVKDAGWRATLLQANPTEKGTYIADDSGYSIIACLMRTPNSELAYVVPSYQDWNASEQRWTEFYTVTEDMSVRNYRVDALAVMYIERGTFFLQKTKGRLTRRPQYF